MLHWSVQCCLKVPATASVMRELDESLSRSESLPPSQQVLEHPSNGLVSEGIYQNTPFAYFVLLCLEWKVWATRTGLSLNARYCSLGDSYAYLTFNQSAMPRNSWTCGFWCPVQSVSTCTTLFHLRKVVEHFLNYLFDYKKSLCNLESWRAYTISTRNSRDFR